MKLVVVESPFWHPQPIGRALRKLYLRAALRDSIARGESPFASHAVNPLALSDTDPVDRSVGIGLGHAWGKVADVIAFYDDLGTSKGMEESFKFYSAAGAAIEFRQLGEGWWRE